jgi:ATP-dependent DNA helicase RecQ
MVEKPSVGGVVRGGVAGKGGRLPAEVSVMELGFDEALFEKLKRHRTAMAKAEGVPAHRIFSNQTLEFMTRLKPLTLEAGKKIRGVGDVKAVEYLSEFIRVIQKHLNS